MSANNNLGANNNFEDDRSVDTKYCEYKILNNLVNLNTYAPKCLRMSTDLIAYSRIHYLIILRQDCELAPKLIRNFT